MGVWTPYRLQVRLKLLQGLLALLPGASSTPSEKWPLAKERKQLLQPGWAMLELLGSFGQVRGGESWAQRLKIDDMQARCVICLGSEGKGLECQAQPAGVWPTPRLS